MTDDKSGKVSAGMGQASQIAVKGGLLVAAIGVLGSLFVGWVQIFAIVAFNLPENPAQLGWVSRVVAGSVLLAMVVVATGFVLAFIADRLNGEVPR